MSEALLTRFDNVLIARYCDCKTSDLWTFSFFPLFFRLSDDAIVAHGELSTEYRGKELYFASVLKDLRLISIRASRYMFRTNGQLFLRSLEFCGNLEVVQLHIGLRQFLHADFAEKMLSSNPGIRYLKLSSEDWTCLPEGANAFWITTMKTIQKRDHSLKELYISVQNFKHYESVIHKLTAACLEKQTSHSMIHFYGQIYYHFFILRNEQSTVEYYSTIFSKQELLISGI